MGTGFTIGIPQTCYNHRVNHKGRKTYFQSYEPTRSPKDLLGLRMQVSQVRPGLHRLDRRRIPLAGARLALGRRRVLRLADPPDPLRRRQDVQVLQITFRNVIQENGPSRGCFLFGLSFNLASFLYTPLRSV